MGTFVRFSQVHLNDVKVKNRPKNVKIINTYFSDMVSEVAKSVRRIITHRATQTVRIIVRVKDEIVAFHIRIKFLKANMFNFLCIEGHNN